MVLTEQRAQPLSNAPLRVAFLTVGCRSNYADTVNLQSEVLSRGAVPCELDHLTDVCVLNTCTVTDGADRDVLRLVRRARETAPGCRVLLTGCLARVRGSELALLGSDPHVSVVTSPEKLVQAVFQCQVQKSRAISASLTLANGNKEFESVAPPDSLAFSQISRLCAGPGENLGELSMRARFHLRIQDGCDNACSYCIVPRARGRLRSKPIEHVMADIRRLSELGYEEVVLSGTHLGPLRNSPERAN